MLEEMGQWSADEQVELRKVFFASANEVVDNLQDALLAYETAPDKDALTIIKRYVHTLKGDSNSVGLRTVGELCHRMEDIISQVLMSGSSERDASAAVDLLFACVDAIRSMLGSSEAGRGDGDNSSMIQKIDQLLGARAAATTAAHDLSEYEDLQVHEAEQDGLHVYDLDIRFHPQCAERGVAARMAAERLTLLGRLIHAEPPIDSERMERSDGFRAVLATDRNRDAVSRETVIAGIIAEVGVREHVPQEASARGGQEGASAQQAIAAPVQTDYLRIEASRVDRIMNLVGELIIGRSMSDQVTRDIKSGLSMSDAADRIIAANAYLDRTVADLQRGVMKMRMVPVNQVFRKFPKLVRDLAAEKQKTIHLEVTGKETEVDKSIVDSLGEPLAHIIRNMIDHGIESPADRRSAGKDETGHIELRAYYESSQVVVEISDDGRGIDTAKLRRRAVEKGFLSSDDAAKLAEDAAAELIYLSGLSTADVISETSGRGVGMDAVKAAVVGMRGTVETHTEAGKGTRFRLRLPLTLAVIKALIFGVGDRVLAVPLAVVSEITKIMLEGLKHVDGRDTLVLRDKVISLIRLDRLLHTSSGGGDGKRFALLLGAEGRGMGLLVDRIVRQQELVIKPFEGDDAYSEIVSGASILGDGKVVLILDVHAVVRKAVASERDSQASAR